MDKGIINNEIDRVLEDLDANKISKVMTESIQEQKLYIEKEIKNHLDFVYSIIDIDNNKDLMLNVEGLIRAGINNQENIFNDFSKNLGIGEDSKIFQSLSKLSDLNPNKQELLNEFLNTNEVKNKNLLATSEQIEEIQTEKEIVNDFEL